MNGWIPLKIMDWVHFLKDISIVYYWPDNQIELPFRLSSFVPPDIEFVFANFLLASASSKGLICLTGYCFQLTTITIFPKLYMENRSKSDDTIITHVFRWPTYWFSLDQWLLWFSYVRIDNHWYVRCCCFWFYLKVKWVIIFLKSLLVYNPSSCLVP